MKRIKTISVGSLALLIAACSAQKKITAPSPSGTNTPVPATSPATRPLLFAATGVFSPGDKELSAIQLKYKEVTMQTLKEGHAIYTGVCTGCHEAKSIYMRPEEVWPGIINSMAVEAKITDAQKDAVYKYVLAIKSTQPR